VGLLIAMLSLTTAAAAGMKLGRRWGNNGRGGGLREKKRRLALFIKWRNVVHLQWNT